MSIRRKLINVKDFFQPNRVLIDKSSAVRVVVPEEVIVQPRLTVGILVLQAEGLVSSSGYVGFALQFAPTVIIAEPNQIAVFIGHLAWDGDLVAMEVVGLLVAFAFGIGVVVYLCQGFVSVGIGVEIGIPAVELGDQLVNAAAGINFGEQQPCAEVGRGDLVEGV